MGTFFPSFRYYIEDVDDLCQRVTRIDQVIDALLTLATTSALEDDVRSYRLNDGQTIINVERQTVDQLMKSVRNLELVKNMYINRINGRGMRLTNHEDTRYLSFLGE